MRSFPWATLTRAEDAATARRSPARDLAVGRRATTGSVLRPACAGRRRGVGRQPRWLCPARPGKCRSRLRAAGGSLAAPRTRRSTRTAPEFKMSASRLSLIRCRFGDGFPRVEHFENGDLGRSQRRLLVRRGRFVRRIGSRAGRGAQVAGRRARRRLASGSSARARSRRSVPLVLRRGCRRPRLRRRRWTVGSSRSGSYVHGSTAHVVRRAAASCVVTGPQQSGHQRSQVPTACSTLIEGSL